MYEKTKGKIMSKIPELLLCIFKLEDKYEKNPFHKFNKNDILILKNRDMGHGIRPVAVVNDYKLMEDQFEEKYDITLYKDKLPIKGYFPKWIYLNEVPQGVERIVNEHEIHSKLHIEYNFKKVNVNSIDEALALYASKEVEQNKFLKPKKT